MNLIFNVKDVIKSTLFYERLGFKVVKTFKDTVVLKTSFSDTLIELRKVGAEAEKVTYKFSAKNISGLYEKFKILGAPIHSSLKTIEDKKSFIISDTDGNKLEFIENLS